MPKINRTPAALLRKSDDRAASDGQSLPGPDGWQVRLRGALPDQDGMITVESVYRVRPEEVGLYVRPGSVTVEMTDTEADAVSVVGTMYAGLGLYQKKSGTAPAVTRSEAAVPEVTAPEPPAPFPQPGERAGGRASTG